MIVLFRFLFALTILLEYHTNVISCNCSILGKGNPRLFMIEYDFQPVVSLIALNMMITIGVGGS